MLAIECRVDLMVVMMIHVEVCRRIGEIRRFVVDDGDKTLAFSDEVDALVGILVDQEPI
jgi:hypothetical protein